MSTASAASWVFRRLSLLQQSQGCPEMAVPAATGLSSGSPGWVCCSWGPDGIDTQTVPVICRATAVSCLECFEEREQVNYCNWVR